MKTDYKQQAFRHPILIALIEWLEETTGFEFVETSSRRIDDDGVHGTDPTRGTDLRCRSLEIGLAIEALINRSWTYDPKRINLKCCLLHGVGSSLHLHLQVHSNTKFKG